MARRRLKCDTCTFCNIKAPVEIVRRLEILYRKLLKCGPDSPLIKYIPREVFDIVKYKCTVTYRLTLLDVLQAGLQHYESVGMFAADAESYDTFKEMFNKVLEVDYNMKEEDVQPPMDFGDPSQIGVLDKKGDFVQSVRIRCSRALKGYPFNPGLTFEQYLEIESKVSTALLALPENLAGTYLPLNEMEESEIKSLRSSQQLFQECDEVLTTARMCPCMPVGRGYFKNDNVIIWVNEKDHIRIISMNKGSNLQEVYEKIIEPITALEESLKFAKHKKYGYLSSNPFSIGTGLKCSVQIKLPKLGTNKVKLLRVIEKNGLQIKGVGVPFEETKSGLFEVSSKQSIGLTEFEVVNQFVKNIKTLIKEEKMFQVSGSALACPKY